MAGLEEALGGWRAALGVENVTVDAGALAAAEVATFATSQRIPAILRPANTGEVQQCLRVATAHGVPVYPVSAGRNWGYGSRVPARDGCVLLDLGRMNRVLEHDEQLATLTVEPGVTFQQAYEYLEAHGSRLFITTIGGPPGASLVGNALERGDGMGPNGDVFNHVCGLEVVLPTGECIHTGPERFPEAKASRVFRWGLGPSLDGLFSQSNLGVVTRMTFWLSPKAPFYKEFVCTADDEAQLEGLVDRLQGLLLEGTLRSTVAFWNDYKALSVFQQYPFDAVGGRTPLPPWVMEQFHKEWWGGAWNATGGLYAADAQMGIAAQRRLKRVVRGAARKVLFSGEEGVGEAGPQGAPSDRNLAMAYWRKRKPVPVIADPDRDGCGFIWCACAVPFRGADVREALAVAGPVPRMLGFEPNLALIGVSPRCLYLVAAITYDRAVPGEDARAMACHNSLMRELCDAGYYPSRLGIQSADTPLPAADSSPEVLRRIKAALDPAGILSPGRYIG